MERSPSRLIPSLTAGLGGTAASFAGICLVGALLIFSVQWGDAAHIVPPMLAIGLAIAAAVSLVNGAVWFILVRKETSYRVVWMLLSLACTLSTPVVAPIVIILATREPQVENLLCFCGAPLVLVGLVALAFRFSLPKQPATTAQERKGEYAEPERPPTREPDRTVSGDVPVIQVQGEEHPPHPLSSPDQASAAEAVPATSRGCLAGFITFGLGLVVPCLTAGAILLLLYVLTLFLLSMKIIIPGTGHPGDVEYILSSLYILLMPVVTGVATLIISLLLSSIIVAPRIPSKAGKILNTILFSLLSAALALILGFVVVAKLYGQYNPGF